VCSSDLWSLLALSTYASRKMRMVIAAQSRWTLNVTDANGNSQQLGRVTDWNTVSTVDQLLTGPGPWTLTALIENWESTSGFWNALWIDGQPFSQTSTDGALNKWQLYNTTNPPADASGRIWTNPAYTPEISAQGWKENFASTPDCVSYYSSGGIWDVRKPSMASKINEATAFASAPLPQPVLPLWFPTCKNNNEKHYYRMVIAAGDQANVVAQSYPRIDRSFLGRNIEMVTVARDSYTMSITDNVGNTTSWGSSINFGDILTYRKTLTGPGPWTITVTARATTGSRPGFFATNWVDGSLFSVTGANGASNKWEIWPAIGPSFAEPPNDGIYNWTHPNYSTANVVLPPTVQWIKNHASGVSCTTNTNYPRGYTARLDAATSPANMGPIWYPDCLPVNIKQYFRLVIPAVAQLTAVAEGEVFYY